MRTTSSPYSYQRACALIAGLRAVPGPGTPAYVDAKIAGYRGIYSATIIRRFKSGRYLLAVEFLGRSYRISTDPEHVGISASNLYRKRESV